MTSRSIPPTSRSPSRRPETRARGLRRSARLEEGGGGRPAPRRRADPRGRHRLRRRRPDPQQARRPGRRRADDPAPGRARQRRLDRPLPLSRRARRVGRGGRGERRPVPRRSTTPSGTRYLDSNRWQGKAGAYGVQDRDPFVAVARGSFSNVVGLPMERLAALLRDHPSLTRLSPNRYDGPSDRSSARSRSDDETRTVAALARHADPGRPVVAHLILAVVLGLGVADRDSTQDDPRPIPPRRSTPAPIDGARAYGYLKQICAIGPRPAGSAANAQQRQMVAQHFTKYGGNRPRAAVLRRRPAERAPGRHGQPDRRLASRADPAGRAGRPLRHPALSRPRKPTRPAARTPSSAPTTAARAWRS